jgi:hypothetical protein
MGRLNGPLPPSGALAVGTLSDPGRANWAESLKKRRPHLSSRCATGPATQSGLCALSRPTARKDAVNIRGGRAPIEIGLAVRPKPEGAASPDCCVLSSEPRRARGSHVLLHGDPTCRRWPADSSIMARCGDATQRVATRWCSRGLAAGRRVWHGSGLPDAARPDRTPFLHGSDSHVATHVSKLGRHHFWVVCESRRQIGSQVGTHAVAGAERVSGRVESGHTRREGSSQPRQPDSPPDRVETRRLAASRRVSRGGRDCGIAALLDRDVRLLHRCPHPLAQIRRHAISHLNHLNSHLPGLQLQAL